MFETGGRDERRVSGQEMDGEWTRDEREMRDEWLDKRRMGNNELTKGNNEKNPEKLFHAGFKLLMYQLSQIIIICSLQFTTIQQLKSSTVDVDISI